MSVFNNWQNTHKKYFYNNHLEQERIFYFSKKQIQQPRTIENIIWLG